MGKSIHQYSRFSSIAAALLAFLFSSSAAFAQVRGHEVSLATGLGGSSHQDGFNGTFDGSLWEGGRGSEIGDYDWDLSVFLVLDDSVEVGSSLSNYNFSGAMNPLKNDSLTDWKDTRVNFFSWTFVGKYYFLGEGILRPYLLGSVGATYYTDSTPYAPKPEPSFPTTGDRIVEMQVILPLLGGGGGLELVFLHPSDSTEIGVFAQAQYEATLLGSGNLNFVPLDYGLSVTY